MQTDARACATTYLHGIGIPSTNQTGPLRLSHQSMPSTIYYSSIHDESMSISRIQPTVPRIGIVIALRHISQRSNHKPNYNRSLPPLETCHSSSRNPPGNNPVPLKETISQSHNKFTMKHPVPPLEAMPQITRKI